MPKFRITENVPSWVSYEKIVEAASQGEALELAQTDWAEIEGPETGPLFGDIVDGYECTYEAEPFDGIEKVSTPGDELLILVYGSPKGGFTFVGPFTSRDKAEYEAEEHTPSDESWWICSIHKPEGRE